MGTAVPNRQCSRNSAYQHRVFLSDILGDIVVPGIPVGGYCAIVHGAGRNNVATKSRPRCATGITLREQRAPNKRMQMAALRFEGRRIVRS